MIKRVFAGATLFCALMLVHLAAPKTASAGYPEIWAEAVCDPITGTAIINFTASTPSTDGNPQIEVRINGVLVSTGAFEAPDYAFSGSAPAPSGSSPGDTVVVSVMAVGNWGGSGPGGEASIAVTLPPDCGATGTGRFTGGGSQIRIDGVRVTRGLTLHCDLLLSNNLEINWQGNSFHMLEHMTTVSCTDDPAIIQAPPDAPLDTMIGVGNGRYNGTTGYTVEFTLVDAGEPGTQDMMAILVYQTANPSNVILEVPLQLLDGGNLQAHYDQPHK